MLTKKVAFNVFDIFLGKGWDQWVRMERIKGKWTAIAGDFNLGAVAGSHLSRKFK